jgi:hypothetical protein
MSQEEKGREARIQELEREIADLKARWPKHSVPPAMLMRLEELEEELERLLRPFDGAQGRRGSGQAGLGASS